MEYKFWHQVLVDIGSISPEQRAEVYGLLHWCPNCLDSPEDRFAIEEKERKERGLPNLHKGVNDVEC